jgi:Toxin SymE, type I toxin-antitoxin system
LPRGTLPRGFLNPLTSKKMNTETRVLKVGYLSRPKTDYVNNYPKRGFKKVPQLQIGGNWFAAAGFEVGEDVRIIISENCIQILKDDFTPLRPVQAAEPGQLNYNLIGDFVNYIDGLHYEGYSENVRRNYPDQWEELLRQYENDYGLHA